MFLHTYNDTIDHSNFFYDNDILGANNYRFRYKDLKLLVPF